MKKLTACHECRGKGYISYISNNQNWSRKCENCNGSGLDYIPITNYERIIQQMTPEKLAEMFDTICEQYRTCKECPLVDFASWGCNKTTQDFLTTFNQEAIE